MSLLLFFTGVSFRRSGVSRLALASEENDNWELIKRDDEEVLKIIKKFLEKQ